ncbi:MAG: DUF2156 domain-containing protein [Thermodesulfobacteriota bacterium]
MESLNSHMGQLASSSAATPPVFPRFKPIALEDRKVIQNLLWHYQPETSELTFTNLFMWRPHYGYQWCLDRDRLLVVSTAADRPLWALPPIGPQPRADLYHQVLEWLRDEYGVADPAIERADPRLAAELDGHPEFAVEAVRDHFDYVYRSDDLAELAGGKYHSQRNHVNSIRRSYNYRYEPLREEHLSACLYLCARWCQIKKCEEDLSLTGEWEAIGEVLANYQVLGLQGGVILINDRVQAFSCGELLNRDTAVIHLEKADPELRSLYAVINQEFTRQAWAGVPFINREQDLGEPGLRKAKMAYHPHRLVEKFRLRLAK